MSVEGKSNVGRSARDNSDLDSVRINPESGAQPGVVQANTPLFTIITVCLNAGRELHRTVQSVLKQNFDAFQLLIKDGGSTDGSLDSLPRDPRIRIIRSSDRGIFDAMNQALDAATGRFIHFLNAGDLYVDGAVLGILAAEIEHSEETEFFYGDVLCPGFNREQVRYRARLSRYFLYTHMLCHQAWFVARETYFRMGKFKLGAKIGSDQVFLYDAILGGRVRYRHVSRFVVRYETNGVSSNRLVQAESRAFREAAQRKYFPCWERSIYSVLWWCRNVIRSIFVISPLLQTIRWLQEVRQIK